MTMTLRYPSLVTLGGVELTEEGRSPVAENYDERSIEVELASGKIKKYIKKLARTWTIEWELVPGEDENTIDGKGGRNTIREIVYTSGTKTFLFKDGLNGTETYTVFVDGYSETLTFRRAEFRYKISLELKEQG